MTSYRPVAIILPTVVSSLTYQLRYAPLHDIRRTLSRIFRHAFALAHTGVVMKGRPIGRYRAASDWADRYAGDRITQITEQARQVVQDAVADALENRRGWKTVATEIDAYIQITPRDRDRVEQMREVSGNAAANAYAEELRQDRVRLIAEQEIRDAVTQGQIASWQDAQDQGLLPKDAMKTWVLGPTACPLCEEIADTIPIDDEFDDGVDGPTLHVGCSCSLELEA